MIKALLKIRLKQIYRSISGIGLLRMMVFVGMIGSLGIGIYVKTSDKLTSQYFSIGFLLLIMLIHYLENGQIKFTRDKSGFSEFEREVFNKIENDNIGLIKELIK